MAANLKESATECGNAANGEADLAGSGIIRFASFSSLPICFMAETTSTRPDWYSHRLCALIAMRTRLYLRQNHQCFY